jgi:hypothetical protein
LYFGKGNFGGKKYYFANKVIGKKDLFLLISVDEFKCVGELFHLKNNYLKNSPNYCLSEQIWRLCLSSNSEAHGGPISLKFLHNNLT